METGRRMPNPEAEPVTGLPTSHDFPIRLAEATLSKVSGGGGAWGLSSVYSATHVV